MNEKYLTELILRDGANELSIKNAQRELHWNFPTIYKDFLLKYDGGEGFVGDNYVILWASNEIAQFNNDYQVQQYAPGLVLFGSNGAGEGYAFDARVLDAPIVQVPFIGMELSYAEPIALDFDEFFVKLAEDL